MKKLENRFGNYPYLILPYARFSLLQYHNRIKIFFIEYCFFHSANMENNLMCHK